MVRSEATPTQFWMARAAALIGLLADIPGNMGRWNEAMVSAEQLGSHCVIILPFN